jgi:hypothetical protein
LIPNNPWNTGLKLLRLDWAGSKTVLPFRRGRDATEEGGFMTILSERWADDQGKDIAVYAAMLVALLVIVIGTIVLGRR